MGAAKYLELAVILKAVDNLSGTVRNAVGGAGTQFDKLRNSKEKADESMRKGLVLGAGAKVGIDMLTSLSKKYGDVQEAQNDLRIAMLRPGGGIDEGMFSKYADLAVNLSKKFGGTQMSYYEMIRAMQENRLDGKDILGGVGFADAELSELFKSAPSEAAIFTARMKNDMRVPASEMVKMVDLVARLKQVGVGHTGSEAITNLTEFYSKAGLGASNLGLAGTKDAMELGALGGMFIAKGQDAPSVGTTFRRIFDNIANPKKMEKMNEAAAKFGKHLVFYDKAGHFKGIKNLVAQLSTLQGMTTSQISEIVGPMGSAQGMSGDVLKSISEFGKADYLDFLNRIATQGDLTAKVAEYQKGLNAQLNITGSNIDNLAANTGKTYNPIIQKMVTLTGKAADALSSFVSNHPDFTGWTMGAVGGVAGLMALGSAIHFIGATWAYSKIPLLLSSIGKKAIWDAAATGAESFAMSLLTSVVPAVSSAASVFAEFMASATAGLSALALAPVAFALYEANYGSASKMLDSVSRYEKRYTPVSAELQAEWNKGTHKMSAAENKNIADLEKKRAEHQLTLAAIDKKTGDRDFSKQLAGDMAKQRQAIQPVVKPTINYSPTIHIHGDADKKTLTDMLDGHKNEIMRLLNEKSHNERRLAF